MRRVISSVASAGVRAFAPRVQGGVSAMMGARAVARSPLLNVSRAAFSSTRSVFAEAATGTYPCDNVLPYTADMKIVDPSASERWPVFRVMEVDGSIRKGAAVPGDINDELALKMYKTMVRLQAFDDIFYNAQRQGRISFYMQNTGEEATHIGSAAALKPEDTVFAQYREAGVLMWRGFSMQAMADQCFSNCDDLGKGRQMPVHYGTKELNFHTISSPLATQLPQAAGAAYANKLSGNKAAVICYFGEGAASEGDFHAALNFAATLTCPVIFFCRNNGFAISTPVKDQYRGDGIISRASGYGMHAVRVDGNDLYAVYEATKAARKLAVEENKPVLIEAMSYRVGHHSTSDDSTRYRSAEEIKSWQEKDDPVARFRRHLEGRSLWTADQETALRDEERALVLRTLEVSEAKPKASFEELFNDVYDAPLPSLMEQAQELREHMQRHPHLFTESH